MQSSFINLTSDELDLSYTVVTSNGTIGLNNGSSENTTLRGHSFVTIGASCNNSFKDQIYGQIEFEKIQVINEWYGSGSSKSLG